MVSSKIKEAFETRPFWPGERDDAELGAHHGTLRAPLAQPPDALSDLEIAPLFLRSGACQATEPDDVCADRFMGPDPKVAIYDGAIAVGLLKKQYRSGWHVTARASVCGQEKRFNFIATHDVFGGFNMYLESIGNRLSWAYLGKDTMTYIHLAATLLETQEDAVCDQESGDLSVISKNIIDDSEVGPAVFGVRMSGEWTEAWRFKKCGREATIPVHYRADGKGGAFIVVGNKKLTIDRTQ